ncbi:glycosyltransferase family 2 protein [Desulfonatronum parangueonense]
MTNADSTETPSRYGEPVHVSIILPVHNEAETITGLIRQVRATMTQLGLTCEIIVIDDGSTDGSAAQAQAAGAKVVSRPCNMGNGAAVKAGVRLARGRIAVLMDGDGQHDPADIPRLLQKLDEGYDMVVGARNAKSQASLPRLLANTIYNRLASWMTGCRVDDLTSGFRAVRLARFREFLHLLPNGFSYPTSSTMAFFRSGYPMAYVPITAGKRAKNSNSGIRPLRDGLRFLLIILRIGTLYSPLKLFVPVSAFFFLSGFGHYIHTYLSYGRFTNMSALLLSTSVLVFLIGLVSEQITQLIYRPLSAPDPVPKDE